jgi:hypothetical protein
MPCKSILLQILRHMRGSSHNKAQLKPNVTLERDKAISISLIGIIVAACDNKFIIKI